MLSRTELSFDIVVSLSVLRFDTVLLLTVLNFAIVRPEQLTPLIDVTEIVQL